MRVSLVLIGAAGLAAAAPSLAPSKIVARQDDSSPDSGMADMGMASAAGSATAPVTAATSAAASASSDESETPVAASDASDSSSSSSSSRSGSKSSSSLSGVLSGLRSGKPISGATLLTGGLGAIGKGVTGGVSAIVGHEKGELTTGLNLAKGITSGVFKGVKGISALMKKAQQAQAAEIAKLQASGQLPPDYLQQAGLEQGYGYGIQPPIIPGYGGQVFIPVAAPGYIGFANSTSNKPSPAALSSGASGFFDLLKSGWKNALGQAYNQAKAGSPYGSPYGAPPGFGAVPGFGGPSPYGYAVPGAAPAEPFAQAYGGQAYSPAYAAVPGFGQVDPYAEAGYGADPYAQYQQGYPGFAPQFQQAYPGFAQPQSQPDLEIYQQPDGPTLVGANGSPFGFFGPVGYQIVPHSQGAAILPVAPGAAAPPMSAVQQNSVMSILKKASKDAAKAQAAVQSAEAADAIANPPAGYTYVPVPISALASGQPIILTPQGKFKKQ